MNVAHDLKRLIHTAYASCNSGEMNVLHSICFTVLLLGAAMFAPPTAANVTG